MADEVTGQALLELEQELGAGHDFPAFIGDRVVAGEWAFVAVADDARGAAVFELLEGDSADRGAGLVEEGDASIMAAVSARRR